MMQAALVKLNDYSKNEKSVMMQFEWLWWVVFVRKIK